MKTTSASVRLKRLAPNRLWLRAGGRSFLAIFHLEGDLDGYVRGWELREEKPNGWYSPIADGLRLVRDVKAVVSAEVAS